MPEVQHSQVMILPDRFWRVRTLSKEALALRQARTPSDLFIIHTLREYDYITDSYAASGTACHQ